MLKPASPGTEKWFPVPLTESFNYQISDRADSWPGYGAGNTLEQVFAGDISCGQVTFRMAGEAAANNVILLSAQADEVLPATPVTIPLGRKAHRLAFLATCNVPLNKDALSGFHRPTDKPGVGKYTVEFEDATTTEILLCHKWNIVDWNYTFGAFAGRLAYSGETRKGNRLQLMRTDWLNPYPDKTISWNTVVQMRLNFWFIGGAPITRIMLDDMSWSATVERDQTLNRKWYDD